MANVMTQTKGRGGQAAGIVDNRDKSFREKKIKNDIQSNSRFDSVLQRRVLTIGEEDAEVRYSKRILLDDTGMPEGKFEASKTLRADQPEIILGHGTTNAIGGKDANAMTKALKSKIFKKMNYDLVFFACNTGKQPEQGLPLGRQVQTNLSEDGYENVSIQAPKGIALVLGNQFYLVTNDHPITREIRQQVESETVKPEGKKAVDDVLNLLSHMDEDSLTNEAWAHDAQVLRAKNWTKLKEKTTGTNRKTSFDVFIDAIAKKKSGFGSPSVNSIMNTQKVFDELISVKHLGLNCSPEEFEKWLEDVAQNALAEKMRDAVTEKNSETDEVSKSTGQLGNEWDKAGNPLGPAGSYFL